MSQVRTAGDLEPADTASRATRAATWALVGGFVLVTVAMALPAVTGWYVHVFHFPPLHADWSPRLGWGTAPALVLGALGAAYAGRLAQTLSWGRLLLVVFAGGLAWLYALAFVDGPDGIGHILTTSYEYLDTAKVTTDFPATLREYVSRIPYSAEPDNWPVHIAGHPPGALGFFVVLVRLGMGEGFAAGTVVTVLAATTAVAVLVTMRLLGAETWARRAAPFLVLGPAAIWQAVSADAMFAAVAAWGMAALAAGATARDWRWLPWSLMAGLLLGYCVMLSYGLPLLGILAVTVLWLARRWRPLVPAVLAACAVVGAFAVQGFAWWEALPVLQERYYEGVGGRRQPEYWMWANLAALTFAAGPLVWSGLAEAAVRWRALVSEPGTRVVLGLSGAGLAMVVAADLSQMSRAEVERIWLPFVPWLLVACALLPERWRTRGLWLQVTVALVVQHLLFTGW